jgi:hypothetical protein
MGHVLYPSLRGIDWIYETKINVNINVNVIKIEESVIEIPKEWVRKGN